MGRNQSSKKAAIVTRRPQQKQPSSSAAKGRITKPQASNASSPQGLQWVNGPISNILVSLTEEGGHDIADALATNLTSEGVLGAFRGDVLSKILRRSPRDKNGDLIKTRECGRPEDLVNLDFNEVRHLPLKMCLLCNYIGSRGNTTSRHSKAHGTHDKTLFAVPWQVCLVKDAVPSGSMEEFKQLLKDHSGHKPMNAYKKAGSPPASEPYSGSALCLIPTDGTSPSIPQGREIPAAISLESTPAWDPETFAPSPAFKPAPELYMPTPDWTLAPLTPSPAYAPANELKMAPPTHQSDIMIDPILLGPLGDPYFSPATYYPGLGDGLDLMDGTQEVNMMMDQSRQYAAYEPHAYDHDNEDIRGKRAWFHLRHGGQVDYTPLITVY